MRFKPISIFWYRRICELALVAALVVLGLYIYASFMAADNIVKQFLVPLPAAILAIAVVVVAAVSRLWEPEKYITSLSFTNYSLLVGLCSVLIVFSGGVRSPYLISVMMATLGSGIFGLGGLALAFAIVNFILAHSFVFLQSNLTAGRWVLFIAILELPLVISYFVWRRNFKSSPRKARVYVALAQELSQVANKSEIVINAITEGVIAIDAKGQIQLINPAAQELLGWGKQDALGLDYRSVIKLIGINGKELLPESSPIQQVLSTNKPLINNDLALITHSAKKILISLVISPMNQSAQTAGAIVVMRDITDEKAEERQKAEFISTASHEMRTPVAAVEGYLGLALNPSTASIDDKARAYLLKAQESTQHLGKLFQDLLTVSRAEDNRLVPKFAAIDIVAFAREVAAEFAGKAQAKGLFLYFKPGNLSTAEDGGSVARSVAPVFYVYADQGQLREILNNLLDNAIKYTKQGSITVDITSDESNVAVSVADTGIGVPPEDLSHLFQKFYRIDNSDTREIGGTGLGLYISRRLTEANNGRIWAESVFGKGSTFFLQLPRISREKAEQLRQAQEHQTPSFLSR